MTVFKVKEISKYISNILKKDMILSNISVEGEVSNFKKSGGHLYFSIKDDEAMLKCVVFKTIPIANSLNLTDGQKVVVKGSLNTYEKGSYYQILCKDVEQVGKGNLYEDFLKLKEKLFSEGLFSSEYKKTLKEYPKSIGVVTAINGAAIRDILNTLRRRYKIANIYIYPVKVQGIGASDEIRVGLEYLDKLNLDVIIVGRGGGSFEDLNAFNDEMLARSVFNAKTPIISAVGHEVDTMITDFVADVRASTPTAGAELSAKSLDEIISNINLLEDRMNNKIIDFISGEKIQLEYFLKELNYYNPVEKINSLKENLENLKNTLDLSMKNIFDSNRTNLDFYLKSLNIVSPDSVLKRGYSIASYKDKVITSIKDIKNNDELKITLFDGEVITQVKEILDVNKP